MFQTDTLFTSLAAPKKNRDADDGLIGNDPNDDGELKEKEEDGLLEEGGLELAEDAEEDEEESEQ